MDVYSFTIKGHQVDMTFKKGFIAYTFERGGQSYGQKIKVSKRGVMDIVALSTLLTINALESIEAIEAKEKSNESIS